MSEVLQGSVGLSQFVISQLMLHLQQLASVVNDNTSNALVVPNFFMLQNVVEYVAMFI